MASPERRQQVLNTEEREESQEDRLHTVSRFYNEKGSDFFLNADAIQISHDSIVLNPKRVKQTSHVPKRAVENETESDLVGRKPKEEELYRCTNKIKDIKNLQNQAGRENSTVIGELASG